MSKDFSTPVVSSIWNRSVASGSVLPTSGGYLYNSATSTKKYRTGYNDPEYKFSGNKNKTDFPQFVNLLKKTQPQLKKYLGYQMRKFYPRADIHNGDGYLYIQGSKDYPVMLVAHMDTVHKEVIKDFYERIEDEKHVLASPQGIGGDDRCGIWTILSVLRTTDMRPSILFCEDEEIGCVGSGKFCRTKWAEDMKALKFMVEIDRRGNNDAVFYDDVNEDFHQFVEDVTGYKEAFGSCSDICNLSESAQISSVNLSSGYYHEHHFDEEVVYEEMMNTAEAVKKLVQKSSEEDVKPFEYKVREIYSYNGRYGGYSWYDEFDDYDYDDYIDEFEGEPCSHYVSKPGLAADLEDTQVEGTFTFIDTGNNEHTVTLTAESKLAVIGKFMIRFPAISWYSIIDVQFTLV